MSAKAASIAQVMMVVALVAVNLFVFRAVPWNFVIYPTIWVFVGCLDLVVFWKLIRRRSLQAFHYTFLVVLVTAYTIIVNQVAMERFRPLSPLVRGYQQFAGVTLSGNALAYIALAELWTAGLLALVLAIAAGCVAKRLERRRNWDIAAFFRGALLGAVVANLLMFIDGWLWGWETAHPFRFAGRNILGVICLIAGGLFGLSKLKSRSLLDWQESRSGFPA